MNPYNRLVLATEMLEITAKGKRHKKAKSGPGAERSKMLKLIMPAISGQNGDDLIKAINTENYTFYIHTMDKIRDQVARKAFPKEFEK